MATRRRDGRSRRLRSALAIASSGLVLATGCGPGERVLASSTRYEGPAEHRVPSARVFDASLEQTWDRLVEHLASDSIRVRTMDEASHFLVVELRAGGQDGVPERAGDPPESPGRYVDCGRESGQLNLDGEQEAFDTPLAEAGHRRALVPVGEDFELRTIERRPSLTALATLHLRAEADRTRVGINVRYSLSLERMVRTRLVPRSRRSALGDEQAPDRESETLRFTSFDEAEVPSVVGARCRSTGVLERRLLDSAAA